jgi:hypothetical protein
MFTTGARTRGPVFNQGVLEIFSSRSAENFSIKVWLKNENQGLIDPDQFFDRDHDRA